MQVMVLPKNEFKYPMQIIEIKQDTPMEKRRFNVSGEYFELKIYIIPDTFSSGSYAMMAGIEELYIPEAL